MDPSVFGYFGPAIELLAPLVKGFAPSNIQSVPLAWQIVDGNVSSFGWIAVLLGHRRVYFQYTVDETAGQPEDLLVRELAAGEAVPELDDPAVVWFEPRHVDSAVKAGRWRHRFGLQ
jgi:hypothetical protein